jgi:hypothetical protein
MPSSGMLGLVALVRTDVSEERRASIIRVTRIGEVGTTLAVTSNRRTLRRNNMYVGSCVVLGESLSVLSMQLEISVPTGMYPRAVELKRRRM